MSQDSGPPFPPSRVHIGNRIHIQMETPSRSKSPHDTERTFHTQRHPSGHPEDGVSVDVVEVLQGQEAKWTGIAQVTMANTTTPGT